MPRTTPPPTRTASSDPATPGAAGSAPSSPTRFHQQTLTVETRGRGFYDITDEVRQALRQSGIQTGLCVVFCTHTSASLVIQENADPSARRDLMAWLERLAPDGDPHHTHTAEGPDDMPSHLRSAVTSVSESIPISGGDLALGTWQGLFLVEHRRRGHRRRLVLHLQGVQRD